MDNSASLKIDKGVYSDGLIITAFPAAKAGAAFQATCTIGKFHGVIPRTTP